MLLAVFSLIRDPKLYLYVLVGALCAFIDITLFLTLRSYLELHYLLLATLSFFVATLFNYILCSRFVFPMATDRSHQTKLILTYLVSTMGLIIHHTCLFIGYEWLLLPLVISKLGGMGVAFLWNFLSRKYLVFS